MDYETEKIRQAIVRARLTNDPHFSVDIPHDELKRLFADLYTEYWIQRRELAELTLYMLTRAAPRPNFRQGG